MCIICLAKKSNEILVPNTNGDVLNLVTGKVTDSDGNEYDAPQLTEIIVSALAAEGIVEAEEWANKGVDTNEGSLLGL